MTESAVGRWAEELKRGPSGGERREPVPSEDTWIQTQVIGARCVLYHWPTFGEHRRAGWAPTLCQHSQRGGGHKRKRRNRPSLPPSLLFPPSLDGWLPSFFFLFSYRFLSFSIVAVDACYDGAVRLRVGWSGRPAGLSSCSFASNKRWHTFFLYKTAKRANLLAGAGCYMALAHGGCTRRAKVGGLNKARLGEEWLAGRV